jgi:maleate isomerase
MQMGWQADGWEAPVRIGVLVPHGDVGPESEMQAMAPPDVVIHATRVLFGGIGVGGLMDPTIAHDPVRAFAAPPLLDDAAELLAAAPIHSIAYGFTSSAYLLGVKGEEEMVERLQLRTHGIPVVAACTAAIRALHTLGVARVSLVSPPWFDSELGAAGRLYYESAGFQVAESAPCSLPSGQALIEPHALFDWVNAHTSSEAEAVVIGGNGFRAVGVIAALEAELGRPVLTANQVLFWAALKAAGATTSKVTGYGRIFAT